jgi:hypothetical protein
MGGASIRERSASERQRKAAHMTTRLGAPKQADRACSTSNLSTCTTRHRVPAWTPNSAASLTLAAWLGSSSPHHATHHVWVLPHGGCEHKFDLHGARRCAPRETGGALLRSLMSWSHPPWSGKAAVAERARQAWFAEHCATHPRSSLCQLWAAGRWARGEATP